MSHCGPDPRIFEDELWPRRLREDRAGLEAGFARCEAMLTPTSYPDSSPPLAKMEALRRAADGAACYPTPITVTFRAGLNAAGVHQEACTRLRGLRHRVQLRGQEHAAHELPPCRRGPRRPDLHRDRRSLGRAWRCPPPGRGGRALGGPGPAVGDRGATGSQRRRSPSAPTWSCWPPGRSDPPASFSSLANGVWKCQTSSVGRFSGNGDVLGFGHHKNRAVRAIGSDTPPPTRSVLLGVHHGRHRPSRRAAVDEGVIIEDAVVPGATAGLLPLELMAQTGSSWTRGRLPHGGPLSWMRSATTGGRKGLVENLQTLLVMGNDNAEGTVVSDGDDVRVHWPHIGTSAYYRYANQVTGDAVARAGGTYLHNPLWSRALERSLITVHPLGGASWPIGLRTAWSTTAAGCSPDRRAMPSTTASLVWDGSTVARPLGVNPLLTISALAERAVAVEARGPGLDDRRHADRLPAARRRGHRRARAVTRVVLHRADGRLLGTHRQKPTPPTAPSTTVRPRPEKWRARLCRSS